jgi:DNA polymerase elongation subunit (family B)
MKFYTSVNQYGNKVLVRGVNGGKQVQDRVDFKPTLFVRSQKKDCEYKSVYGDNLEPIKFEDINSAKEYLKLYKDVQNFEVYGNTNYAYQYITETFPNEVEFDIEQIKIWSLDIETTTEYGFPNVDEPQEQVQLITVQDINTRRIFTFGLKPFTKEIENLNYVKCKDEYTLLQKFLEFVSHGHPHIITGWNIEFFDIPYLCNRIIKILGEDALKKFSPWRIVNRREIGREKVTAFDIVGIASLDYLDLYKKFTYNAQESYKLDYICKVELGAGKLENPHDTFRDFYTKDWELFVEYNIVDTVRVSQLEDKMKLIELILTMAYDAKCNYQDIFSAVRTWDCILYNHLWNKKIVVHQREGKPGRQIAGAYVKEPKPGKYNWVVSFDATSLYPSIIMQYNMSPETQIKDYVAYFDANVDQFIDKEFEFTDVRDNDYCIAANGRCYTREYQGMFPEIVSKLFDDRQKYKKLMIAAQKQYEETKNPDWEKDISKYNNFQMARKIQLNSLFGAWGNEYFRFYDDSIAEGITLTGQYIIRSVANKLNEYLNKVCKTDGYDYSFYSDTDSCYVTLDPLVQKFYKDEPKEKILQILDKICSQKITEELDETCKGLASYTNAFEHKISFKREAIADTGIWIAKKRYAVNVYNNEGVQYKEPKLKVMGMEIVRSSTPGPVRIALKEAVRLALTGTQDELQQYTREFEEEYKGLPPEEIAFPRGVNGLDRYKDSAVIYTKGTPMHVRGALLYNHHLRDKKLTKKYELIKEGDKIKFLYLKEPNMMGENCVAFLGRIPAEFALDEYVDYDTMFEKSFLEPLSGVLGGIGWSAKPKATLEDLFA